jgi:hypothetical protein
MCRIAAVHVQSARGVAGARARRLSGAPSYETFVLALDSLRAHKLRSFLTFARSASWP